MRSDYKRIIISLIFIQAIIAEPCPSMCNGHGACSLGGVCNCFPGWMGGTCPYGHSYVDPTTTPGGFSSLTDRSSLECSGQGICDRQTGKCNCFDGFEGATCSRVSCPNNCNNHGICTAVKMTNLDKNTHINSFYKTDLTRLPSKTSNTASTTSTEAYDGWDLDQSYVCVCDGEYTGYDCSEKKCPRGYTINSECDTPAESIQTITIGSSSGTPPLFYDSTATTDGIYNCMTYLEYTDMYNRVWYSDAFCVLCQAKGDKAIATPVNFCDNVLGWEEALGRLPVGTIDATVSIKLTEEDTAGKVDPSTDAQKITKVVATISFGSQQTGRQKPIKLFTETDLKGDSQYAEQNGKSGSGFHGMTIYQLYLNNNGKIIPSDKAGRFYTALDPRTYTPTTTVTGISPLECSRHGVCNRNTGLCECFEGYYGLACTEQAAVM